MNDLERERSMPVFIFVSMVVHSLLFLFGPQIVSTLLPGYHPGDQGGVTYVTLIEAPPVSQPRAAVPRSALRPQSTPEPRAKPEPRPAEPTRVAPPAAPPAPEPARQSVSAPQGRSAPVAERPQQTPAPAPRPEVESRPTGSDPARADASSSGAPVLASERGPVELPTTSAPRVESAPPTAAEADEESPPARAEGGAGESAAGPEESGSGAAEDQLSSAPQAQPAPEPALPPTGLSMVNSFGGALFPKDAVGLVTSVTTVEVAAIVSPEGEVVETVLIRASGIDYIDGHAQTLASRGIQFKPHQETYEIRVFVTYDGRERQITYDVGDFIRVPPTVGSAARL